MLDIAWPLVVFQLLNVAYNVTDTIWLGHYSTDAVGALSIAWPLVFLFISIAGGFNSAGATLVAQYTGADSEESAGKVTGNQLTFVVGLAVILGLLGFLLSDQLLALLPSSAATTTQIIPMANEYMRIFYLGLPFMFTFFVFSTVMRGYGDTKTPMYVMAGSVALNVVIDPILIFGFAGNPLFAPPGLHAIGTALADLTGFGGLGVSGAALATVSSRGLAAVVGIGLLFFGGYGPDVRIHHLRPDLDVIRKIVDLGLPTTAEQSAAALGMITMTAMVSMFSPAVVAAYGLTNRIGTIVFLPSMGLGRATNTMVGQNLGAEKPDRAERATWVAAKAALAVLLIAAVVAFVFPEAIVGVFLGTGTGEAAALAFAATYLQVRAFEFGFMGVFQVMLGAFRGAGNTRTAMVLSIIALWLGRVPLVYVLAVNPGFLGVLGIWIGFAAGDILGGIVAVLWFTRGTWKQAVIEESGTDAGPPTKPAEPVDPD